MFRKQLNGVYSRTRNLVCGFFVFKEILKVCLKNRDFVSKTTQWGVQMEMERAAKAINAKDEFAYQLKEQKAINADQLEELKVPLPVQRHQ